MINFKLFNSNYFNLFKINYSPLRAFLLDVCNTEDQDTGLNIHAFLGGLGSAFGYVISAIKWEKTILKFIGDELQILFVSSLYLLIQSIL